MRGLWWPPVRTEQGCVPQTLGTNVEQRGILQDADRRDQANRLEQRALAGPKGSRRAGLVGLELNHKRTRLYRGKNTVLCQEEK